MTDPEPSSDPAPETIAAPPVIMPTPAPPPPPPPPPQAATKPAKAAKSGGGLWRLLGIIGFLLLAAGEIYLWRLDQVHQPTAIAGFVGPGMGTSAQPATDAAQAAQIGDLQSQIAALQQSMAKTQPAPDSISVQADLGEKIAVLTAQISALQTQFATDHATVTTLAANAADLSKLSTKIQTLNELADARMALDSGQPLGPIPGAPAALAVFATAKPPTMADLVLAYPQAAAAANAASAEKTAKTSFWRRVLARLESLITISNGDKVLVGAPAAAITAQAQTQLDAGDLAGAVNTLTQNLSTSTQAAMGGWLAQAKSLLAARAAIIQMSQS